MPNPFMISGAPAELMARIHARRATIPPGMTMMANGTAAGEQQNESGQGGQAGQQQGQQGTEGTQQGSAQGDADRAALEAQIKELQGKAAESEASKKILADLAAVFAKDGEKPDPLADLAAIVGQMKADLDAAKAEKARDTLAQQIAEAAGVTDAKDVALIKAQADETTMKALAARLKGTPLTTRTLRPDPSQGQGGSGRPHSVAEAAKAYRERHQKN